MLGCPEQWGRHFFLVLPISLTICSRSIRFTPNDAKHMISLVIHTLFCRIRTRKIVILTKHFFYRYHTLASLYSSNDFRTVTHKFVTGLLVLLRHKCICLLIKHLTIFRTYIIVHFFIHHSTLQQCNIAQKSQALRPCHFGKEKI